jgi:hypothetical protein
LTASLLLLVALFLLAALLAALFLFALLLAALLVFIFLTGLALIGISHDILLVLFFPVMGNTR